MTIHQTAVVDSRAELDSTVEVGAYAVIESGVRIGSGTSIAAHAVVASGTTLGCNNQIGSFTSIGTPPQDTSYKGEDTELVIGDNNIVREYTSINRGTANGGGRTEIGDDNLLMASVHVGHDCRIGNHIIMANVAMLAGHVEVGDYASISALVGVHQFCRIGVHAYIGGMSGITHDVAPYVLIAGTRNQMRVSGINKIGLRRKGFSRETIAKLDEAFRIIFRSPNLLHQDALVKARDAVGDCEEVELLVRFFEESKRGVAKRTSDD
ncbi:MAG: acyl-ACP--UDP-N-acetylglucosamine O-acyltransferase [Desulfobulbaceae bacterium]|uniref:Acyl-[acyl-carrier-protein]--UDP-N-acetylglucosamine O-acyltransferase n=1 Tax=Candidatus Desulfatifera sulfidica TaxID=2841691 RepID=A0A8J6TD01_9BACT|nr:acyl-ACP--UDP-N-acetylglucosamine O-acyltransferase [Candidatus Desulfatifera sulfidica]